MNLLWRLANAILQPFGKEIVAEYRKNPSGALYRARYRIDTIDEYKGADHD